YLPACCKQLLGEELAMPSVQTWWCGDPSAFAEVLARIDDVVIKPAFPTPGTKPLFTAALTLADREALVAKMRARPAAYVAQEHAALSKVPTMLEGALAPRSVVLRCFASVGKGDAPSLMPGGLARVAVADSGGAVSMQHGARSADVWVVSRER